jgi:hypothetical protein
VLQLAPWFKDAWQQNPGTAIDRTTATTQTFLDMADLFRLFEFVETPSRFRGAGAIWDPLPFVSSSGAPQFNYPDFRATRVAGKMNINSITAEEVFRALIDSPEANPTGFPADPANPNKAPMAWSSLGLQLQNSPSSGTPTPPMPTAQIFGRQFPLASATPLPYANPPVAGGLGQLPTTLVGSEMYRRVLQSLAGKDQILGTLDDLPFRSFAQRSIKDTILRPSVDWETASEANTMYVQDAVSPAPVPPAAGYSANRRRLFDGSPTNTASLGVTSKNPSEFIAYPVASPPSAADENQTPNNGEVYRRNSILAKIAGNVTTRSHNFAGWMTIGWFRVVPGTENNAVPLLDREIGSDSGNVVRHRAFFIVDRSLATGYTGPRAINDVGSEPIIRYFRIIE